MQSIEQIRNRLPEAAKDTKLNVQAVLTAPSSLNEAQRWGVALASAYAARNERVWRAVLEAARERTTPEVIDDAKAAATLMAMNNVLYRFRHMVEKPSYGEKRANLRMNRLVRPATNKADFELYSLVVSAINGCSTCVVAHERAVIEGGLSEDQVHDAIRIAATIHALAVAEELSAESDAREVAA